ncbi:substrate-binding domain-containing protein [Kutzneria buriramensis]|uniref:von Willebrand factor type A domain-containing protein n=1 Tax=Kutzneria buriramensis TaxID=1045776 RepID=A0A3E0HV00_9PSEU|nr:substrate-binding domain-containing protein [Kutzneria buriramensis]REH50221.1 von Willebrand factor type A domain-containing protein [Kutzneria buriramensis]
MVAALAVGGVVVANTANSVRCAGEVPLRVAVTPSAATAVQSVADAFQHDQAAVNGQCVKVSVVSEGSADVVQSLPTRPIDPPALWIPDSSLWVSTAQDVDSKDPGNSPKLAEHPSLASSPLVVAASTAQANKLGWPKSPVSWQRLVTGQTPIAIADPVTNTEGVATLGLAQGLLPAQPSGLPPQELIAILLRLRSTTLSSVTDGFAKIRQDPENAILFTTTEQSVVSHNVDSVTASKAVAIYPAEGTVLFDYPVVRVTTRGEVTGTDGAAAAFEQELRSARSAGIFAAAGFRDSKGAASATWGGKDGVQAATPPLLPAPSAAQVSTVLRAWNVVHLDGRTLAVIDVSGSMTTPMPDGQSRIEVARDGALAAMSLMPDSTYVGLWAFSQQQGPPNDWKELVPLGPLGGTVGGISQRFALQQAATSLPARVRGGTALYDTAFAAYETLRDDFDPTKVNAVVLITDGKNEKQGGLDLTGLLSTLRAQQDSSKPVEVIGIGLGPDADMNALNQIAQATGGKAYQAQDANSFRGVLFDALSRRPCTGSGC